MDTKKAIKNKTLTQNDEHCNSDKISTHAHTKTHTQTKSEHNINAIKKPLLPPRYNVAGKPTLQGRRHTAAARRHAPQRQRLLNVALEALGDAPAVLRMKRCAVEKDVKYMFRG